MAEYQVRSRALKEELSVLLHQREDAAAQVTDKALLKRYEEIRAKAGGIGIARIDDNSCGGCHVSLPSAVVRAVKDGETIETCENCRRLLTV